VVAGGGAAVRAIAHADDIVDAAGALNKADNLVDTAADACRVNSFSAETPVATPDGDVPIVTLAIGDLVYAWDEATGTTGVYTVTDTISHIDPVIMLLTIGDETLETTPEHPFYTIERGWVDAEELRIGEHVPQLDGDLGAVQTVALEPRTQPMYNLSVAVAHTFFVGDEAWLVHNCGGTTQDAATALADTMKRPPVAGQDPLTVGVLETPSAHRYPGQSGSGAPTHPTVQAALDNVPLSQREGFHGQCAEIQCLSSAAAAGETLQGSVISTARVRGPNSTQHGTSIPPCRSCEHVLQQLGVKHQ
jgi:hypothetical protein